MTIKTTQRERIATTLEYLRQCMDRRRMGHPVAFTTDPSWLIQMAINRRAGWPDDPSFSRGSCMPVDGRYPRKAEGDAYNHLALIAREINTPLLIVRPERCGEWRALLEKRIPNRLFSDN